MQQAVVRMIKLSKDQKHFKEIVEVYHTDCILHPGGWGEDLPKNWQNQIIGQRLALIDSGNWDKATDYEAAIYLSSLSGVAPLNREYTNIFIHECALIMGDQIYNSLNDESGKELSHEETSALDTLKTKIRNSQLKRGVNMNKRKILIEEREDGVLLGLSKEKVDPFVKKIELTFDQLLTACPFLEGVFTLAETGWEKTPLKPKTSIKNSTSTSSAGSASTKTEVEPVPPAQTEVTAASGQQENELTPVPPPAQTEVTAASGQQEELTPVPPPTADPDLPADKQEELTPVPPPTADPDLPADKQ
ncbi:MAG: hypothetical protein PHC43_00425, partial [Candidatus Marinimicrobia bacterium]|nr:hypothetical protein [Candidatus Neomarinimicrobiota bacterium]